MWTTNDADLAPRPSRKSWPTAKNADEAQLLKAVAHYKQIDNYTVRGGDSELLTRRSVSNLGVIAVRFLLTNVLETIKNF